MRSIEDIKNFRRDISPFLVHLTRTTEDQTAQSRLKSIIAQKQLKAGNSLVSQASFGLDFGRLNEPAIRQYFQAISFTETPLDQIHCLLEIERRDVNLEPYGLVFLKKRLQERGVAPVIYLNNELGDKAPLVAALVELIEDKPDVARQILPLIAIFGKLLPLACEGNARAGHLDFLWEREWRWPRMSGDFSFDTPDVFLGLCPHDEIQMFEGLLPDVHFVDPRRTMSWYSTQLDEMRKQRHLRQSVV